jgi:hypothetical protein
VLGSVKKDREQAKAEAKIDKSEYIQIFKSQGNDHPLKLITLSLCMLANLKLSSVSIL